MSRATPASPWRDRLRTHGSTMLLALLVVVCLTGGGSRADIASLAFLRFVSALAVCAALVTVRREDLVRIALPLALLAALAVIAGLQLVPLPPSAWSALPGRDLIGQLDALLGLDVWRPVTLSPFKTANSLASLVVPLAVLLLFAMTRDRTRVLVCLVAMGVLGALIGIVQVFVAPSAAIYFYDITNRGEAVGLFANRNHHAVYLACCALISLHLTRSREIGAVWRWGFAACALVLAIAVLGNASRAGVIALLIVGLMSLGAYAVRLAQPGSAQRTGRSARGRVVLSAVLAVAGVAILALFALAERSPALSRILGGNELAELRARILPHLVQMVAEFQPLGAGLGAFEYAYRMGEPVELLGRSYLNQAHNDWLQFLIEGGIGAIVVLAGGAIAAILQGRRLRKMHRLGAETQEAWLGLALLVVLGVASLVDYPLRVPSVMALAIIALAMFSARGPRFRPATGRHQPDVNSGQQ